MNNLDRALEKLGRKRTAQKLERGNLKGTTTLPLKISNEETKRGKKTRTRDRNLFLRKPEGGFLSSATKPRKDARGFLSVQDEKQKERTVRGGRKEGERGQRVMRLYLSRLNPRPTRPNLGEGRGSHDRADKRRITGERDGKLETSPELTVRINLWGFGRVRV